MSVMAKKWIVCELPYRMQPAIKNRGVSYLKRKDILYEPAATRIHFWYVIIRAGQVF
jgi:hypothetical protein